MEVEIRRSARRRSSARALVEHGRIVVQVPAGLRRAEEDAWVRTVVDQLRERLEPDSEVLLERARRLDGRYLGGHARPRSVSWVEPMSTRWASCTPADGTIRISRTVGELPRYVRDYVLLHELAHFLVSGHGIDFWTLLAGFPKLERARGFLDGHASASEHGAAHDPGH